MVRRAVDERGELREARGDDPAAVEPDAGADRTLRRDEERHAPTEAEAHDADLAVGESDAVEVVDRRVHVGEDRRVAADPDEVLHHRAEVAVVDHGARSGPVEHVGRDCVVTRGGEAPRHVLDVRVHTERFLDHDHGAARLAVGNGLVQPHRSVGSGDFLISGGMSRRLSTSMRLGLTTWWRAPITSSIMP